MEKEDLKKCVDCSSLFFPRSVFLAFYWLFIFFFRAFIDDYFVLPCLVAISFAILSFGTTIITTRTQIVLSVLYFFVFFQNNESLITVIISGQFFINLTLVSIYYWVKNTNKTPVSKKNTFLIPRKS